MWRTVFGRLSPAGQKARLSTLIFHRVLPQPDELFPGEVDAKRFDRICSWVRHWFNVLPLQEATQRLCDGTLPERAMAITFDDGYADNALVAMPVLQRHGLVATFFVSTGYLDGGCMWNDVLIESVRRTRQDHVEVESLGRMPLNGTAQRRAAIDKLIAHAKYLQVDRRRAFVTLLASHLAVEVPRDLMMSATQLRRLRGGGMGIGAHTVSHPILTSLAESESLREMRDSKACLQSLLQERVDLFAYPNGRPGEDYSPHHILQTKACGFTAAFSTTWGVANRQSDIYQIPRFTPWDRPRWRFAARLTSNLTHPA